VSKEIKPPKTPKKTKSVFHKKSDAGKGDVPRVGITLDEWGERWEKIFKPQVSGSKTKNNTRKVK